MYKDFGKDELFSMFFPCISAILYRISENYKINIISFKIVLIISMIQFLLFRIFDINKYAMGDMKFTLLNTMMLIIMPILKKSIHHSVLRNGRSEMK